MHDKPGDAEPAPDASTPDSRGRLAKERDMAAAARDKAAESRDVVSAGAESVEAEHAAQDRVVAAADRAAAAVDRSEAAARAEASLARDKAAEARDVACAGADATGAQRVAADRVLAVSDRATAVADRDEAALARREAAYDDLQSDRDVTAEFANRSLRLLRTAVLAVNEASTVEQAMQTCLEAICAHSGWSVGHCYWLNEETSELVPSAAWHLDEPDRFDDFRRASDALRPHPGEGLPGRVLASGGPAWISDLSTDDDFHRAESAIEVGLKGAFALPIVVGSRVVGVLEFFSPEAVDPVPGLLDVLAQAGTQLGWVVGRTQALTALEQSLESTLGVIETAGYAFIGMDAAGLITDWNAAAEVMLGWGREEAIGRRVADTIIPLHYRAAHDEGLAHLLATGEAPACGRNLQLEALHRDGHELAVELWITPMRSGRSVRFNAFLHDISDRKATEETLTRQAFHDPLTGLPNRLLLLDRRRLALARYERGQGLVTVLYIDLDHFKAINDTLGHGAGDQVLCIVAERIRAVLRPADTAARLGGDEFVILCEGLDGESAAQGLCSRLEAAVAAPCVLKGGAVTVTASIGVVMAGSGAATPESLLGEADAAMYLAKQGGGRVQ